MRTANTVEERTKIRDQHRNPMEEPATKQGFKVDENQDDEFFVPDAGT